MVLRLVLRLVRRVKRMFFPAPPRKPFSQYLIYSFRVKRHGRSRSEIAVPKATPQAMENYHRSHERIISSPTVGCWEQSYQGRDRGYHDWSESIGSLLSNHSNVKCVGLFISKEMLNFF